MVSSEDVQGTDAPLKHEFLTTTLLSLCTENGATDVAHFSCSTEIRIAAEIIIATVHSERILGSLTEELRRYLKDAHCLPAHGVPRHDQSGWVIIDCGEVVVHLMSSECRSYYQLERLYTDISTVQAHD